MANNNGGHRSSRFTTMPRSLVAIFVLSVLWLGMGRTPQMSSYNDMNMRTFQATKHQMRQTLPPSPLVQPPPLRRSSVEPPLPADWASRLRVRCDQGSYMGFTNIWQTLVDCVVIAVHCNRSGVEFPMALQNAQFGELFDLPAMVSGFEAVYGVRVHFVPGPVTYNITAAVRNATSWRRGYKPVPYAHPARGRFSSVSMVQKTCRRADGLRVIPMGDVWPTQLTLNIEMEFRKLLLLRILRPTPGLAYDIQNVLSTRCAMLARLGMSARGTPFRCHKKIVGVHLRFESDRWAMASKKSQGILTDTFAVRSVDHTKERWRPVVDPMVALRRLVEFVELKFGGTHDVLMASGRLAPQEEALLPPTWFRKETLLGRAPFAQPYLGAWFDGRPMNITNSTGALTDSYLLMWTDATVMPDFSSMGEIISAARCDNEMLNQERRAALRKEAEAALGEDATVLLQEEDILMDLLEFSVPSLWQRSFESHMYDMNGHVKRVECTTTHPLPYRSIISMASNVSLFSTESEAGEE
eukprot:PhM_4_TR17390/c0_g1_i1/m.92745